MSLNCNIDAIACTKLLANNFDGLAVQHGIEQDLPQPVCVALLEAERVAKNASLMPAARMAWREAIIFDFANVEDRVSGVRQR